MKGFGRGRKRGKHITLALRKRKVKRDFPTREPVRSERVKREPLSREPDKLASFRRKPLKRESFKRKAFKREPDKRLPHHGLRSASKYRRIIIFTIFLILLTVILVQIDKKAFPQIYEMARIQSMNKINNAVNFSVTDISSKMNLTASDFYVKSFDEAGRVCDIAVNTILVNEFCANLAQDISGNLVFMENEKVSLPIGSLSGLYYLANLGPSYSVSVRPMGETRVDYDCSFESVGINQVNFQIWLMVEAKVLVVNPLKRQEIELSRKVSLVNTVITGDVPDTYLNAGGMFGG